MSISGEELYSVGFGEKPSEMVTSEQTWLN